MNRRLVLLAILPALIGAAGISALGGSERARAEGETPLSLESELRAYLEEQRKERKIVGLSAAVIAEDRTVLLEGFGLADRERGIPVSEGTLFPIGSTTKLFTATAIMQLAAKGLVDLDAPIETYLPAFQIRRRPGQAGMITVRNLLTHHSGLPGNLYAGFQPDELHPREFLELPGRLADQTLAGRPDEVFAYSNLGYALLGCIVESVSGLPYTTYVRQNLLEPLRMEDTLMLPPEVPDARTTLGYRGKRSVPVYAIRDLPAGSMLSSATDMAAFMRMILNAGAAPKGRILEPASFEQMITRQNGDVPLDQGFAIGLGYWLIDPIGLGGERLASHGGDLPPFHSVLVTLPDAGIAVFLAGNSSTSRGAVITMASEVVRRVYERVQGVDLPPREPAPRVEIDAAAAAALAGLYASPMGLMEITARGARLSLKVEGLPLKLQLVPRADGACTPELRLLRLFRLRPEGLDGLSFRPFQVDGERFIQIAAAGVSAGAAMRFEPPAPPEAWRGRTGHYRIAAGGSAAIRENLRDIVLEYDRRRGLLLLRYRLVGQRMTLALKALGPDEAVTIGCGSGLGETLHWDDGPEGPALCWSGLTLEQE